MATETAESAVDALEVNHLPKRTPKHLVMELLFRHKPLLESLVNRKALTIGFLFVVASSLLLLDNCRNVQADPAAEAPPPAKIVPFFDVSLFQVQHPEQFPLATSGEYTAAPELT